MSFPIVSNSASSRTKPATMSTGLVIQVPEYLTSGEKIRIFLFGVFELLVWQKKIKDQLKK